MTRHRFHEVDVFARRKYAGNQLAVVEDAADLSDGEMGAIAAEFDFSETTFVESTGPGDDGSWDVRIFTPEEEIPFAGHPTLGTAWTIRERIADDTGEEVVLDLGVGEVPVTVESGDPAPCDGGPDRDPDGERLWMRQQPPEFRETFDHDRLAAVLGLDPGDLDREHPVRAVSTGLPTTVVPLRDRAALTRIDVDRAAYDEFVAGHEARNVLAFCPEPRDRENDLAVRVFAPYYGVPEDPATGSSNGCLAAYLLRHEVLGTGPVDVRVEQGYEMGRPSLLSLRAREDDGGIAVEVGGGVVPVAEGELL